MLAIDNEWSRAEVRGQQPVSGAGRDGGHLSMMDGGNLQLLIAPKDHAYDSGPKSHTWREREGQKPRQVGQSAKADWLEK